MRKLTFTGFLTQHVKHLSRQETNSLYKLTAEAANDNPRLRAPLLLYAMVTGRQVVLLSATTDVSLHEHYAEIVSQYSMEQLMKLLKSDSPLLAEEYHKVWRSYVSRRNRFQEGENAPKRIIHKTSR